MLTGQTGRTFWRTLLRHHVHFPFLPSRATSLGPLFASHNHLPSLVVLPLWCEQIPPQILLREAGSTALPWVPTSLTAACHPERVQWGPSLKNKMPTNSLRAAWQLCKAPSGISSGWRHCRTSLHFSRSSPPPPPASPSKPAGCFPAAALELSSAHSSQFLILLSRTLLFCEQWSCVKSRQSLAGEKMSWKGVCFVESCIFHSLHHVISTSLLQGAWNI